MKHTFYSIIIVSFICGVFAAGASYVQAQSQLEPRGSEPSYESDEEDEEPDEDIDIRELVEDTFEEDHVMVDVARCESSFRQFDSSGDVLVNPASDATGVFQFLPRIHEEIAEDFGYDIYEIHGNIEYAKELYEADGLKPWSASSLCWDDGNVEETNPEPADASSRSGKLRKRVEERRAELEVEKQSTNVSVPEVITQRLIIGVEDPEVKELQQLLNNIGYTLAESGPGSPGEETSFFGSLTKQALQDFQCDQDIICEGSEYTTGFGMATAPTRAALNQAALSGNFHRSDLVQKRDSIEAPKDSDLTEDKGEKVNIQAQINELMTLVRQLQAQIQ